jgi:hypothetical protein
MLRFHLCRFTVIFISDILRNFEFPVAVQGAAKITPTFEGQYMYNVGVISAAPCTMQISTYTETQGTFFF